MLAHLLLIVAILVGHAALIALIVNVSHGIGWHSRWSDALTLAVLGGLVLLTLPVGVWALMHPWADWPLTLKAYAVPCLGLALVGLPITTVLMKLRRPPAGASLTVRPFDAAPGGSTRDLLGTGGIARLLSLPGNESLRPTVHDWELPMANLPPALDGLKIVLLSDLHMAPGYSRRYFEVVADQAAALEPDLVLCTGDVVEHPDAVSWIEPVLGRVRGQYGQFSILGNHDHQHGAWHIQEALVAARYVDLEGRWLAHSIVTPDGTRLTLALGGILAPWGSDLDATGMPEADLRIVVCHTPDHFNRIAGWGCVDLMFSGHNHGGQIRLPVIGPVLMPSRYSRRYDRGFFRSGRTLMYVSQGLGAKHPIRWNCPPELTRLTLRRAVATPSGRPESAGAGRHSA